MDVCTDRSGRRLVLITDQSVSSDQVKEEENETDLSACPDEWRWSCMGNRGIASIPGC